MRQDVVQTAEELLDEQDSLSSGQLAEAAGISRQAAHYHLHRLVQSGDLTPTGKGRSSAYVRTAPALFRIRVPLRGLSEDVVWQQIRDRSEIVSLRDNVRSIVNYALTEMLNNAIDHSRSDVVAVTVSIINDRLRFSVIDEGIGIFENVRGARTLSSEYEAIAQLQKGRVTTMPSRHTGEGIFFVSKMCDLMFVESHALRWIIDNIRQDKAVETVPNRHGTKVHWEIALDSPRIRERVFEDYQVGKKFKKTRTAISLFNSGDEFVSRSEGKRLTSGLEDFQEVELDFSRVRGVGQGFADEVFRVWKTSHPETNLIPVNMNDAVRFMVERAIAGASDELPVVVNAPHAASPTYRYQPPDTTTGS